MSTLGKLKKKLILQSIQNNQQAQQGQNAQQIILKDLYEKTVEKKSLNNHERWS